jgi:hypothetical protein
MPHDEARKSATDIFASLAGQFIDVTRNLNEDGRLCHPSGVFLVWDYEELRLFSGPITEIAAVESVRLWRPDTRSDAEALPFIWMIKASRLCCKTAEPPRCTAFLIFFDVNELLDEIAWSAAHREILDVLNQVKSRTVKGWIAEAVAPLHPSSPA